MEEKTMFLYRGCKGINRPYRIGFAVVITAAMIIGGFHQRASAADVQQKTFKSPGEAVKALIDALKVNDQKDLMAIFGPAGKDIITSGDEVSDKTERDHFIKAYEQKSKLAEERYGRVILYVGNDDWPFPIPITKKGDHWRFSTQEGKEEILTRRIGKDELETLEVCLAMVDAQREYALKDRDGDGLLKYAQKFVSDPGKHNGLYWPANEGEEQSPLGPLAARAVREGYGGKKSADQPVPYHGYFYRMLKAQGKNAPGGAYDYVVNGKMIGGFAIVAYPAEYGKSGIMTFIVNQDGIVYQKNLGKNTTKIAEAMAKFDPDKSWTKVEERTINAQ
jgi:hypothetical protein